MIPLCTLVFELYGISAQRLEDQYHHLRDLPPMSPFFFTSNPQPTDFPPDVGRAKPPSTGRIAAGLVANLAPPKLACEALPLLEPGGMLLQLVGRRRLEDDRGSCRLSFGSVCGVPNVELLLRTMTSLRCSRGRRRPGGFRRNSNAIVVTLTRAKRQDCSRRGGREARVRVAEGGERGAEAAERVLGRAGPPRRAALGETVGGAAAGVLGRGRLGLVGHDGVEGLDDGGRVHGDGVW